MSHELFREALVREASSEFEEWCRSRAWNVVPLLEGVRVPELSDVGRLQAWRRERDRRARLDADEPKLVVEGEMWLDGWVSYGDKAAAECKASRWEGLAGLCRWCNGELPKRRQRWCCDECASEWNRNHWWTVASHRRKVMDGWRCVDCDGFKPEEAYEKAKRRSEERAWRWRRLEVHHLVPILGRHGESGCHHHLDGLVTVCVFHHRIRHGRLLAGLDQATVAA